jgi:hypothetical protein
MSVHIVALLPVGKLFDRVYEGAFKPLAREEELTFARVETEFSVERRLEAAQEEIRKADLVIGDLTGRNPNVMYLAGYAHGIGKRVLFVAEHGEDFPFDSQKHTPVIYAGNIEFLKEEVRSYLDGKKSADEPQCPDSIAGREKFLSLFGDILAAHGHKHEGEIYMENPGTFVLVNQDMDLALVQDLARRGRELRMRIKLL